MRRFLVAAVLLVTVTCLAPVPGAVYKLYYLGGQSNMDGYGFMKELPAELAEPVAGVRIYQSSAEADNSPVNGAGKWSALLPWHRRDFKSDGVTNTYSDRFGVELTLARRLRELDPTSYVALLKYPKGGTSIHADAVGDFGPTVRQEQADFCAKDACAALVSSTDKYGYSDKWHYDTAGCIDLGKQFAEALHALEQKR